MTIMIIKHESQIPPHYESITNKHMWRAESSHYTTSTPELPVAMDCVCIHKPAHGITAILLRPREDSFYDVRPLFHYREIGSKDYSRDHFWRIAFPRDIGDRFIMRRYLGFVFDYHDSHASCPGRSC